MNVRNLSLAVLISANCSSAQPEGQPRTRYAAVEIDRFVGENGVTFPPDYQITLVEDLVRETTHSFRNVEIVREGESVPGGKPVLRITGNVTKFKPGSRAKRYLIGFGAGSTVVKAQIKFVDGASGQVLLDREIQGMTWIGIAGGSSEGAGGRLAKKIVAMAKSDHLIEPK